MMGKRTRAKGLIVKWSSVPLADEIATVELDGEEEAVDPNAEEAADPNAEEAAIIDTSKDDAFFPNAFEPTVRASICFCLL